jgi:hypothetical protein
LVWFVSLLKLITLAGITYQNITNNLIIKTMRTIDKILDKVNCKYGAPMGRKSDPKEIEPTDRKVFDCKVNLNQGYDKGGAYWGLPNTLRVRYTKDLLYIRFYRLEY